MIIPIREKGIEKEVRKIFPIPNQKEREKSILINPNRRLKSPLNENKLLILLPLHLKSRSTLLTRLKLNVRKKVKANNY